MDLLKVSFEASLVSQQDMADRARHCLPAIEKFLESRHCAYDFPCGFVNLPYDIELKNSVQQMVKELTLYQPAMLIVIGIGGSNLGTFAVQEACETSLSVHYVDTVDSDMVLNVLEQAKRVLKAGRVVIVNIVTKSGTTTETIANGAIFVELLKQYYPDTYQDYIVVTTDAGSKLCERAGTLGWRVLEIPPKVGGRYSVFSAVGLFPLALMGIDIDLLLRGAASMVERCSDHNCDTNIAVQSAAVLYELYRQGFIIHNLFPFSVGLYGLGLWYRQLMAESLGKENSLAGKLINIGITPTVSIGSTDLHSIVELHLGGPRNTSTTFIDIAKNRNELSVPYCESLDGLVPDIQSKSLGSIMASLLGGTKKAYQIARRPYISVTLQDKSAYMIGQFMQWKMMEIVYLGYLLDVNPFIQPQVEFYKKEARALLSRVPAQRQ